MPTVGELIRPTAVSQWRAWLKAHHATTRDIWLVYWPKASGRMFLPYDEALRFCTRPLSSAVPSKTSAPWDSAPNA